MDNKDSFSCVCPHCSEEFVLEQKGLILAAMDPEAKFSLLDFSFYNRLCPKCNKGFASLYPLHYLDESFKNLVRLAGNEEQDKIFPKLEVDGVRAYLVRTAEAMRELILTFDMGMDPVKLQFFKWAYYISLRTVQEQNNLVKKEVSNEDILPEINDLDYLYLTMSPKEDSNTNLAMEASKGDVKFLLPIYKDAYEKFAEAYFNSEIFDEINKSKGEFFQEIDWKMGEAATKMLQKKKVKEDKTN